MPRRLKTAVTPYARYSGPSPKSGRAVPNPVPSPYMRIGQTRHEPAPGAVYHRSAAWRRQLAGGSDRQDSVTADEHRSTGVDAFAVHGNDVHVDDGGRITPAH